MQASQGRSTRRLQASSRWAPLTSYFKSSKSTRSQGSLWLLKCLQKWSWKANKTRLVSQSHDIATLWAKSKNYRSFLWPAAVTSMQRLIQEAVQVKLGTAMRPCLRLKGARSLRLERCPRSLSWAQTRIFARMQWKIRQRLSKRITILAKTTQ